MNKKKVILLGLLTARLCTACTANSDEQIEELTHVDENQTMFVEDTTTETIGSEDSTTVAIHEDIKDVNTTEATTTGSSNADTAEIELWSHNFAHALITDMIDGKAEIIPIITEHEVAVFDVDAMLADIFLIDVNNDGLPEMFAGGHGTAGGGSYSIYDTSGNCWGTDIITWDVLSFETDGQNMYATSGSNASPGHTKIVEGLPQIHANGFAFIECNTTEVTIETVAGESINTTVTTTEEFEALYAQYLDVDYATLSTIDEDTTVYVRDYLRVPDVNNYTEDDIYNCLVPMLNDYVMLQAK